MVHMMLNHQLGDNSLSPQVVTFWSLEHRLGMDLLVVLSGGPFLQIFTWLELAKRGLGLPLQSAIVGHRTVDHTMLLVSLVLVLVHVLVDVLVITDMVLHWLHFKHKISILSKHIRGGKVAAAPFEGATLLVPASLVKIIEVVPPIEVELFGILVVAIDFNVVEEEVPRHI